MKPDMTETIHPFLVEIELTIPTLTDGDFVRTMWRLVFAKDKNGAWDKTEKYLKDVYITRTETKYHITVHDTII